MLMRQWTVHSLSWRKMIYRHTLFTIKASWTQRACLSSIGALLQAHPHSIRFFSTESAHPLLLRKTLEKDSSVWTTTRPGESRKSQHPKWKFPSQGSHSMALKAAEGCYGQVPKPTSTNKNPRTSASRFIICNALCHVNVYTHAILLACNCMSWLKISQLNSNTSSYARNKYILYSMGDRPPCHKDVGGL